MTPIGLSSSHDSYLPQFPPHVSVPGPAARFSSWAHRALRLRGQVNSASSEPCCYCTAPSNSFQAMATGKQNSMLVQIRPIFLGESSSSIIRRFDNKQTFRRLLYLIRPAMVLLRFQIWFINSTSAQTLLFLPAARLKPSLGWPPRTYTDGPINSTLRHSVHPSTLIAIPYLHAHVPPFPWSTLRCSRCSTPTCSAPTTPSPNIAHQ